MWFSYNNDNDWHSITCERVKEIQAINEKGIKVFTLQYNEASEIEDLAAKSTRELELLDKKFANSSPKRKKKPRPQNRNTGGVRNAQAGNQPAQKQNQPDAKPSAPQNQRAAGEQPKKRRNNKSRNKPRNPEAGAAQTPVPQPQQPKAQTGAPKRQNVQKPKANDGNTGNTVNPNSGDAKPKPKGKKRFPPRKNQGPNPNKPGNE